MEHQAFESLVNTLDVPCIEFVPPNARTVCQVIIYFKSWMKVAERTNEMLVVLPKYVTPPNFVEKTFMIVFSPKSFLLYGSQCEICSGFGSIPTP